MSEGDRLARSVELGALCDFYGALLTEKQRAAVRMHCDEDYSFGEIALALGVTRQNVQDTLARAGEKLRRYEDALHGVEKARLAGERLARALERLQGGDARGAEALLLEWKKETDGEEDRVNGI